MGGEMTVSEYQKMVARHEGELRSWLDTLPDKGAERMDDNFGPRTLDEYLSEYGSKFAIVADLAQDLGYPEATRMLKEYRDAKHLEGACG